MNTSQTKTNLRVIGAADFEPEVRKSKQPVLVAFFAPWSRPCQVLDAALGEAGAACGDRAKIVKVNADDNPELSLWYDIQSIPTVVYFVDGIPRARIVGTASKDAILAKFQLISEATAARPSAGSGDTGQGAPNHSELTGEPDESIRPGNALVQNSKSK